MNNTMSQRLQQILKWLRENEALLSISNTIHVEIDIKGMNVQGKVTLLPDSKK